MGLTPSSEIFNPNTFVTEARIWRTGLAGIPDESNGEDLVEQYREKIEHVLRLLDTHMTKLIGTGENLLLELWAARMKTCRNMTDVLDKNLAFKGKRPWSWREVLDAMAMLESIRMLTHRTLLNEDPTYMSSEDTHCSTGA